MNFESMTDQAIAAELGSRIEQLRLERNLTQQQMADAIGLSRVSYGKLESGEAKFVNVIAALRALGQLELLEGFIPETTFSPMALLKMQGKQRQRATGSRGKSATETDSEPEGLDW
jgi:transcriptional regulator with XRE-family HTH domain